MKLSFLKSELPVAKSLKIVKRLTQSDERGTKDNVTVESEPVTFHSIIGISETNYRRAKPVSADVTRRFYPA